MGRIGDWFEKFLSGPESIDDDFMTPVVDDDGWTEALTADVSFIYKHSPICHLSALAYRELQKFAAEESGVPLYVVDVLRNRDIGNRVERELGIRHESPQLILLKNGKPRWHESHWGIKAKAMTSALEDLDK